MVRAGLRHGAAAGGGFEPADLRLQLPGLFLEFQHPADTGEVQPISGQGHDLLQLRAFTRSWMRT
jgi:hypothetical protein